MVGTAFGLSLFQSVRLKSKMLDRCLEITEENEEVGHLPDCLRRDTRTAADPFALKNDYGCYGDAH